MTKFKHKIFKPFNLLRLLGVLLFVFILTRVDLSEIGRLLLKIQVPWLLLGILFQVLLLITKAIRWHLMNDGRKDLQSWIRSWGRFFESYAIGVVTPGRMGEILKVGHEEGKSAKASTVVKMISERGFDLGVFLFFAALALILGSFIETKTTLGYLIMLISLMLVAIAFALLTSGRSVNFLGKLVSHLPFVKGGIKLEYREYPAWMIFVIFFLSLAGALSHFVSCYFLAESVGLDMPMMTVAGGVAIAGMLNLLPITIMGLGTREITFLTLFSTYDHSSVMAFSFTILLVAQIGGGLFSMLMGHFLLFLDKHRK